jgi:hypothetical protein
MTERTSGSLTGFGNILEDVKRTSLGAEKTEIPSGLVPATVLYVFKQGEKLPHLSNWTGGEVGDDIKAAICSVEGYTDSLSSFKQEDLKKSFDGEMTSIQALNSSFGSYPVFVGRNKSLPEPKAGDSILVSFLKKKGVVYGVYEDFYAKSVAGVGTLPDGSPAPSGSSPTGETPQITTRPLTGQEKGQVKGQIITTVVNGITIHDCRKAFEPPSSCTRVRDMKRVTGVVLHRTACLLGNKPKRWETVNAHIGIAMDGTIILMHSWDKLIWHGHAPSSFTVGVEIDGNPEGVPGKWWKPGGGPHDITEQQVKAAGVLFDLLKREITASGGKFKDVIAHRQSTDQRDYDPGWQCWQKIGLPWINAVGPNDPTRTWGTGNPVPKEWINAR